MDWIAFTIGIPIGCLIAWLIIFMSVESYRKIEIWKQNKMQIKKENATKGYDIYDWRKKNG